MSRFFHFLASLFATGPAPHSEPKSLRHGLASDYWTRAPLDHDWRAELKAHWEE